MDKLYHFICGAVIAKLLIDMGFKNAHVVLLVFIVALTKECLDTNTIIEHIKDILFTMIPVFLIIPRYTK